MSSSPAAPERPALLRPVTGRWLGGVSAGVAAHLGWPVRTVRLSFVVLSLAFGLGLVAYAFLWAFTPEERAVPAAVAGGQRVEVESRRLMLLVLALGGIGMVVFGALLIGDSAGVPVRLDLLLPLAICVGGVLLAWSRLDRTDRERWVEGAARRDTVLRILVGSAVVVLGLVVLTLQGQGLAELGRGAVATLVVLLGVGVVLTPYAVRLWRQLRREQEERARATERADIAAHLHDSVLQTLALIQRRSGDPAQVTHLARAQERELRSWLFGRDTTGEDTVGAAALAAAHEVEDRHGVPVEVVVTGDRPLEEETAALVAALGEAIVNAVRHGAPPVAAYVEVQHDVVEAYVRDHGPGFDLAAVPVDRLGVRESIVARMARHGGTAQVRRMEPGTEVALRLPVTSKEQG